MSENQINCADPGVSSPGTILKRCREYHGASLEEAAEATKIAVHHLKALEDDQVKEFANLTYLKGFLRIYAGYLGLNPDDMIRLYERPHTLSDSNANSQKNSAGEGKERKRRRFPWQKLALPAFLLLLMIITSIALDHSPPSSRYPSSPQPNKVAAPVAAIQPVRSSVSPVAAQQKPESEPEQEQGPKREEAASETDAHHDSSAESAKGFVVRLKVVQNGSLAVIIDGATPQNFDLASGDVFEWKADRAIVLELTNAGSVNAELNGRPLKSFGPNGAPAHIVLDANGVK
jgi:cytoskeleton protein RodZ